MEEFQMKDTHIYGIAYDCPKRDRNSDCPFWIIKDRSFEEKVNWIEEIDEEKQACILKHHEDCVNK